jgi:hypothetical protein
MGHDGALTEWAFDLSEAKNLSPEKRGCLQ